MRLAIQIPALSVLLLMNSCTNEEPEKCDVGSEGCECTLGGACDPGLDCLSHYCVYSPDGEDPIPQRSSGGSIDDEVSLPEEDGGRPVDAPEAKCPFDEDKAIAVINEGLGEAPKDRLPLTFSKSGALDTLDNEKCEVSDPTADTQSNIESFPDRCFASYTCGEGCPIVIRYEDDEDGTEYWNIYLEFREDTATEDCPDWAAFYDICVPDCKGKDCGDDGCGGSCGQCPTDNPTKDSPSSGLGSDACSNCLSTCSGLPGCCTGMGCMCQDECASTSGCSPGTEFCCGPYGDCLCLPNCPY